MKCIFMLEVDLLESIVGLDISIIVALSKALVLLITALKEF
jgi:hypothetical protein